MSDLDALGTLTDADRLLERLRAQLSHLPEHDELAEVEDQMRQLAARQSALEVELNPTRDAFNEAADKASSFRQRRSDLEARLNAALAPARELTAMQTELDQLTAKLSDAEDTEVALLLELEPMEQVAEEIKALAQPLVHRRRELQHSISELQSSLEEERSARSAERDELAAHLDPSLLARYEEAKRHAGISGAAYLDGGRCDGCRIALSPLDLDRQKALAPGEVAPCPSCQRLLIRP